MYETNDRRSAEERTSHPVLIGGTDRFLSGWGRATGGNSYCFWACRIEDVGRVLDWIENRGDMKCVRHVARDYRPGRHCAHLSIHVVNDGHPALGQIGGAS